MTSLGRDAPVHEDRCSRGLPGRSPTVLHVGKFFPHLGGIETHLQQLCGELSKVLDVRVVVASDSRSRIEEVLGNVPVLRVPTWFTLASTPLCPSLAAQIRRCEADIIHIHWPNPMAVMSYLLSGHRGRLVVTYHSDVVRQKLLGVAFDPFLHALLRRSSAIITTSPGYAKSSPILSAYLDRCRVIPLGIDVSEFEQCDPAVVSELRREYGDRLILSVGRLVYYKGFEHLIRAMAQVRGTLLIIGKGPLRAELQELAKSLGIEKRVFLMGEIPEKLVPYYHAADIFALPSIARSEAFGIVQIEAMAAGVPVINTQLDSGVPFVSLHEQTGLTVAPGDHAAMASAINRLLDDECLRRSLGAEARLRAQREFSLESMTDRTLALYETVMSQGRVHELS